MAFLDILKGRKREEKKPERLQKGALKQPSQKREVFKVAEKKPKTEKETAKQPAKTAESALALKILLKPHITEQSNILAQKNIYTFRVSPSANKILIKQVIKEKYGLNPIKIRIINLPSKKRKVRGKTGIKSGFKKSLVYLKKGDKIEFI